MFLHSTPITFNKTQRSLRSSKVFCVAASRVKKLYESKLYAPITITLVELNGCHSLFMQLRSYLWYFWNTCSVNYLHSNLDCFKKIKTVSFSVKDMCLVKTMNEQAACNKLFVVVVVVVN